MDLITPRVKEIKKKYFANIRDIAEKTARLGDVEDVLDKCDNEIFHIKTINDGEKKDLVEKFNTFVFSFINKRPTLGVNLNQYNKIISKDDRKKIIIKFLNNNK